MKKFVTAFVFLCLMSSGSFAMDPLVGIYGNGDNSIIFHFTFDESGMYVTSYHDGKTVIDSAEIEYFKEGTLEGVSTITSKNGNNMKCSFLLLPESIWPEETYLVQFFNEKGEPTERCCLTPLLPGTTAINGAILID